MKKISIFLVIGSMIFLNNMPAFAAAPDRVATDPDKTWASSGIPASSTLVSQAQAGNNLDVNGKIVTVINNGTANDGSGLNTFSIGNVTDGGSGTLITETGSANDVTVNINSVNVGNALTVNNLEVHNASNATVITNGLTTGGNVTVANYDTDTDVDVSLTVGGDLTVGGSITVWGGSLAGASADLNLNGSAINFGTGLTLNDFTEFASATLAMSGDQDVTGTIDGWSAAEGTLNVNGTGDTTFNNNIGSSNSLLAINIAAALDKAVEFHGAVKATTVTISGVGKLYLAAGDLTGNVVFDGVDGELEIEEGYGLDGNITTSGNNQGILTLSGKNANDWEVTGTVGAIDHSLGTITLDGDGTGTFDDVVYANALNIANIGTVELDAASSITTTTFTDAGTLDLDATLTGDVVNTGAGGAIDLAAGSILTGNITTDGNNQGTLTLSGIGNSTVSGTVGVSSVLDLATITKSGTGTGTFSNDVFASDTKVTSTGTIAFGGNTTTNVDFDGNGTVTLAAGKTLTGTVLNSTDEFGTLTFLGTSSTGGAIGTATTKDLLAVNINGGTLTLGHNIAAITTTVNNAATLSPNSSRTITGNLTLDDTGTLNLGTNTLTLAGTGIYTQAVNQTLTVGITNSSTFGNIQAAGNSGITGGTVNVTVGSEYIADGTTFTVVDNGGGTTTVPTITSSSSRVSFSGLDSSGDLILTASRSSGGFASLATPGDSNAETIGGVLDNITNPSGDMTTILNTMEGLSDPAVASALDAMVPEVDAGVFNVSTAALNNFVGAVFERAKTVLRLARNTEDSTTTGFSAGDVSRSSGIWAKGYGSYLNQNKRKGIKGYNAWNAGTALGIDRLFSDVLTVGLSGGWAYGNVDSDVNNANTYINSAQTTLYGGYQDRNIPYFINTAFSFAWNWYNGARDINVAPSADRTANASYGGQQYGIYADTGYSFDLGKNFNFTPLMSLQWSHLRLGSYTETEADALNLSVKSQNYDILQSGLGVGLAHKKEVGCGILTFEGHGKWLYDFIGDDVVMTSTFTGGGASFDVKGFKPARNSFNLGCKLGIDLKNDISILIECDTEMKDQFFGIYGSAKLRYSF